MTVGAVLVTGGSGFVGQATHGALVADPRVSSLRLLVHEKVPTLASEDRVEHVRADLADPNSLERVCDGIDTVLHLASHVSEDPAQCDAINGLGTEALVAAAHAAGVRHLIYLSTAAVYGYAVHRGANETQTTVAPATPISRSRARGEQAILNAGGIVLRPLFVYGHGDTKFIPAVLGALTRLPFLVNRGKAKLSVISVDGLVVALAALVSAEWGAAEAGPYHVTDGHPIAFRDLSRCLIRTFGLNAPRWSLPYPIARTILRFVGSSAVGSTRWSESAAHRLFLVTHDHYYDDTRLSKFVGSYSDSGIEVRIADHADWYRRFLAGDRLEANS